MSTRLDAPRLLLPATYAPLTPPSTERPAPKESPSEKAMQRAAARLRHFTAAELVHRLHLPGYASVSFPGGVTLFVGRSSFQARTLAEAMGQADDAGATP